MLSSSSPLDLVTLGLFFLSTGLASPVNKPNTTPCTQVAHTTVYTTRFWPTIIKCTTTSTTNTLAAAITTVTATTHATAYLTATQQTTFEEFTTGTTTITSFTSTETETSTITSSTTETGPTLTTTAVISPSPSYSHTEHGQELEKRDLAIVDRARSSSCTTKTQTTTAVIIKPTTISKVSTVKATLKPSPSTTTITVGQTTTSTLSTLVGPTVTSTATATSTVYATSTTTTTVTTVSTAVVAPTPTYALQWEGDTCGYGYPNIVDIALPGSEEQVVDECANTCTGEPNCVLWEAYWNQGTGRCATFDSAYNANFLHCPDPPYDIGYSIGAQKVDQ